MIYFRTTALTFSGSTQAIKLGVVCVWIAFLGLVSSPCDAARACVRQQASKPMSIEESLQAFEVADGLEVQLVASEPDVLEPVAITFDENGKLYVAEFLKFPTVGGKSDRPEGRIRLLTDPDRDGRFERATVFADGLGWPTGICPWDGGVFVIAAPDLWYLKDTKGDGEADIRQRLWTGFGFSNEEGTANNLIWGIDHWIYGAGSNSGGKVRRVDDPPASVVDLAGADFRFHPVTGQFEAISGSEQFGNTFDDGYRRFICQNSKPIVHVVLPARYLRRNPLLAVSQVRRDAWEGDQVYRISSPEPWRIARSQIRESMDRKWAAPFVKHDVFTATSGGTFYRGNSLPASFHGNLFVGDVQSNLIHRRVMRQAGVSFDSDRVDQQTEVLRSSDNWFRPVNLCNGPDGCLYIVDMYREIIETPDSLPAEILDAVDLNRGHDRGRIYRLAKQGFTPTAVPQLSSANSETLVQLLDHPDSWRRETAQRLIFERQDASLAVKIRQQLGQSQSANGRLHAMYALHGIESLTHADLMAAFVDPAPVVREHAVLLAEGRLQRETTGQDASSLRSAILKMSNDHHPRVRFQVAFTLGELPVADRREFAVLDAMARILKKDHQDPWMQTAVLTSSLGVADVLLKHCLATMTDSQTRVPATTLASLAKLAGATEDDEALLALVNAIEHHSEDLQTQLVLGLAEGLQQRGRSLRDLAQQATNIRTLLESRLATAASVLNNPESSIKQRIKAIQLMAHGEWGVVGGLLESQLQPSQSGEVQVAAIHCLATFPSATTARVIIDAWRQLSPSVRAEAMEILLARPQSTVQLMQAIVNGDIASNQISPDRRQTLLQSADVGTRRMAEQAFSSLRLNVRGQVLDDYQVALKKNGDPARGQALFTQHCATCHRFRGHGVEVGPNLETIKNKSAQEILVQILDPNREIQADYQNYLVLLDDGRQASGRIITESPTSLTLQRAQDVRQTILREQVEAVKSTGVSLMPVGLEEQINVQQMADLLAYLLQ